MVEKIREMRRQVVTGEPLLERLSRLEAFEAVIREDQAEKDAAIADEYAAEALTLRDRSDYPESWSGMRYHGIYHGANDVAIRLRRQSFTGTEKT